MKKIILMFISILIFTISGCGNSNKKTTIKVTKIFQQTTGDYQPFTKTINTQYIGMVENERKYIKIIDTNNIYQTYSTELNQSFEGELDRQSFVPLQSQDINFEKNRLFIIGFFGFAGNGYKEDIYLISEKEVKLIIYKEPYNGLEPKSTFFTLFAYIIDRDIKTLHLNDISVDLNDTTYY